MSRNRHMVQVMHKRNAPEDGGDLAVGKTFRFASGDAYTVQDNGAVKNANPKPYISKADKKAFKKFRREQREKQAAEKTVTFIGNSAMGKTVVPQNLPTNQNQQPQEK